MNAITITVKEYAALYGCSVRYVTKVIGDGNLMPFMVKVRKSGGTWLVDVLTSWYEKKQVPN